MKTNAQPAVNLTDIRAVYAHLPQDETATSAMRHPALLAFVHDPENAANALGQSFLALNSDPASRAGQPLAVAAEMMQADFKIFDLTPPEHQTKPATENDVALAISYGMVTVEQGMDFIALIALGQETDALLSQIENLDDVRTHGAMNVAACYGALIAARMAGIRLSAPGKLALCLQRLCASEDAHFIMPTAAPDAVPAFALDLIQLRACAAML